MAISFQRVTQENTAELLAQLRQLPETPSNDTGGGGGYDGGMEARVTALEEAVKNLPTKADLDQLRLASKADFAELRADIAKSQADMHKAIADNHRWTHGALIGIASIGVVGIIGVMGAIWNAGKPATPSAAPSISAPAPNIIINVPPSAAPPQAPAPTPEQ